ncbi:lysM and putative peptidoglycan-binding domain-containing protein 4 [Sceloporus undulatus]|uniref:lysM and putative peptidoglycan-binding domain-containing protein 4 n=1 Tax=Sceloporus undulatus TaxID=8520 RepID=UPI001C4D85F3|nr:lysM and putative peptidoglycan-binding domain-containing protein 4 [Sceloporus undulatus]XP_042331924.1 lysM and putative peptidoglycan-binding domain-containing protein 4 [Sceloporus undulatus]
MRLNQEAIRSFQAPMTVRTFSNSQVYLFRSGQSDSDESSEEELDVMELRARGKELQQRNASREKVGDVVLLEREVRKDDNLNKLALQYGCKVADIKRINNFIREQDLYALKSIKIPVKVNGVLTETSEELLRPQSAGLLLPESKDSDNSFEEGKKIDQYFRGIDQKIEQAAQVPVLPSTDYCIETPNCSPPRQKETSSGADCGIQWWNAVFVMLLIGIVLPVFYIVYFKTQKLEVTSNAGSNMTGNNSLHGLAVGAPVHLQPEEYPPMAHTPKGTFIPEGG